MAGEVTAAGPAPASAAPAPAAPPLYQTDQEPWDGGRWLKSRFSGRRIAKSAGILIDHIVVVAVVSGLIILFLWVRANFFTKKPAAVPAPDVVTAQSAAIDKSQTDTHVTNVNLPLSNLFSRQDNNTKQK